MSAAAIREPLTDRNYYSSPKTEWKPRHNRWLIAICITIATFMEVLDTSIANVALPHIAGALGSTYDESTWVLTSYLVANAIVLPISAWLSTVFGRKRLYMSCVALFTVSSILCGLSTSLLMLIVFRIAQGAGGGGLGPSEQGILADTFAPEERGMAFAIYGMAVILAPPIGAAVGGWITDHYSWRWLFFINVPAGILSMILTYHMIEDPPYLVRERRLTRRRGLQVDFIGLVLVATFLGPLQIFLDRGEEADWFGSKVILGLAIVWTVSLAALIVREWNHKSPVVRLALFRNRTFALSILLMFGLGFILYGSVVALPQFVQVLLGWTAERAGMVLSPGGFTLMLLMPVAGILVARFDARWLIAIGFSVCGLALYHMTIIDMQIDYYTAMMMRIYFAFGIALLFVPINTMSYTGVPPNHNDDVSSMINLARNIGGSVGIAMTSAIVVERAQFHQANLAANLTGYNIQVRSFAGSVSGYLHHGGLAASHALNQSYARLYEGLEAHSATLAYMDAFYVMAILSVCMVPLALLMKKPEPGRGMVL